MSIDQKLTAVLNTPNKSARQNVPRLGVVLHHAAMTSLSGLRSLAMGAKQVSATNIVKDGQNERLMTDEFRAWSLSSAWGDSSFRSIETCNESTNGWTVSDASHWTDARNVAYWAERDGFWPHRDGDPKTWTVLTHGEMYTIWGVSYATACAGGLKADLVTERAQELLRGTTSVQGLALGEITPPKPKQQEIDMLAFTPKDLLKGWNFLIGPGYIKNAPLTQANEYVAETNGVLHELDNSWTRNIIWNHGLGEFLPNTSDATLKAFLESMSGGAFYVASWATGAAPTLTDAQLTSITERLKTELVAGLKVPTAAEIRAEIIAPEKG